ncbi:MAG: Trk system potassium transporter TrkA, partial [Gammaproteobacteria bacterium]
MKIIILGAGQVGRTAAANLAREEANDVTVVDADEDVLRELQDRLDVRTVAGNACSPSVLDSAGGAEADMIVALTNSDEVNMVACQVAWTLYRTPTKIARIRNPDYVRREQLFGEGGAFAVDVRISPETLVVDNVERLIRYPGAVQVVDFADGRVRLVAVRAAKGSPLVGSALRSLREHLPKTDVRVAAIFRDNRSVPADGDTVVEPDDEVFFVAATADIKAMMRELRRNEEPLKRVMIAGGGNIGLRLAQALEEKNEVKLIERDPRRARRAAALLRRTIVLTGDAADEELLLEENIDDMDVFCAVTNAEEANILSALLAKRLGAAKVMALINRPVYAEMMENDRIDIAISPQTITIGSLLEKVRRGDVVRVHSLRRGNAEAIEAIAHGDPRTSRVVGRTVEQVPLPPGASIGAVVRGDDVIMAHHDTLLEDGDHVILFLTDRR